MRLTGIYLQVFPWKSGSDVLKVLAAVFAPLAIMLILPDWGASLIHSYGVHLALGYLMLMMGLLQWQVSLAAILRFSSANKADADGILARIQNGLGRPELYSFLRAVYGPCVASANQALKAREGCGFQLAEHHAAVYWEFSDSPSLSQICVEDASHIVDSTQFAINADARQKFVSTVRRKDKAPDQDIESGNNYCLRSVQVGGGHLGLELHQATYGQIMRTSDCMIEEIGLFFDIAGDLRFRSNHRLLHLPWRRRLLRTEQLWRTFVEPQRRAAGLGIAALTVLRTADRKYDAFLGFRSNAVATYTQKWHVAPAGMCNTRDIPFTRSYFETAIKSEFLEEVFDRADLENLRYLNWGELVDSAMSEALPGLANGDRFEIMVNGLCFDLLNLRPELCVVILYQGAAQAKARLDKIKLNYEYSDNPVPVVVSESKGAPNIFRNINGKQVPIPEKWVQSGAIAYLLAEKRIRRLTNALL